MGTVKHRRGATLRTSPVAYARQDGSSEVLASLGAPMHGKVHRTRCLGNSRGAYAKQDASVKCSRNSLAPMQGKMHETRCARNPLGACARQVHRARCVRNFPGAYARQGASIGMRAKFSKRLCKATRLAQHENSTAPGADQARIALPQGRCLVT